MSHARRRTLRHRTIRRRDGWLALSVCFPRSDQLGEPALVRLIAERGPNPGIRAHCDFVVGLPVGV